MDLSHSHGSPFFEVEMMVTLHFTEEELGFAPGSWSSFTNSRWAFSLLAVRPA